jgi:hypothetical protein
VYKIKIRELHQNDSYFLLGCTAEGTFIIRKSTSFRLRLEHHDMSGCGGQTAFQTMIHVPLPTKGYSYVHTSYWLHAGPPLFNYY